MLPLYDENDCRRFPIVNTFLIVANIVVFAFEVSCGGSLEKLFLNYGTISTNFVHHFDLHQMLTLFTSCFLHVGLGHLVGNMWVLYLFGDNVEDRLGRFNYLMFYLFCGLMADASQIMSNPNCAVPSIGASGAIAGVLGAYLILFPEVRVKTWVTWLWCPMIPAWLIITGWFGLQCVSSAIPSAGVQSIAWFAHIGGFIAGLTIVALLREHDLLKIEPPDVLSVPSGSNPSMQLKFFVPKLSFGPVLVAIIVGVTAGYLLQPIARQMNALANTAPPTNIAAPSNEVATSSGSSTKPETAAHEKVSPSHVHKHGVHSHITRKKAAA